MCKSVFNKVAGFQAFNFIKKETKTQVFPVNIVKFLRTPPVAASELNIY